MKVHAFQAAPRGHISVDAALLYINSLPFEDRLRTVAGIPVRLEFAVKVQDKWVLDFTWIRKDGPGRASPGSPISDFELAEAEGFGQETACYFDTTTNFLTLQYNHFGARANRIQSYLSRFARIVAGQLDAELVAQDQPDQGVDLFPVLKAEAANKLDNMGIVKNIEFSFSVPGVASRNPQQRQSLSSFLDSPLVGSAANVRVQVSAGRNKTSSLALNNVRAVVEDLLGAGADVSEISLVAKQSEDSPSELVDFLQARLEADIPITLGGNRRFPRDQRVAALKQAFDAWRENGSIG